ncbi:hypothetical protein B0T22DRAFT_512485 [Podospora appendiculata]|uniref:Rhodopsin domain-containing protein n=1 Tax=Podospora appendiculata TaxID=314037 RepID=A0AAE0X9W4_9PEZI|nr:hypothetical protein B0T22DRAFT_512485 [Podospora appendiculata]
MAPVPLLEGTAGMSPTVEMGGSLDDTSPVIQIVAALGLGISVVVMILRCATRVYVVKSFGKDDALMSAAMITYSVYILLMMVNASFGFGAVPLPMLPEEHRIIILRDTWMSYLFYFLTMALGKMSIGWFLLRVTIHRVHHQIVYTAMGATVASCLLAAFVLTFQCAPVSFFWDKTVADDGVCTEPATLIKASYYPYGAVTIVTDFALALLPAWIVSQLQMNIKTKIALIGLMAMGCLSSSAVIARWVLFTRETSPLSTFHATAQIAAWTMIEQFLIITVGSMATLRPLLGLIRYKLGWGGSRRGGVSTGGPAAMSGRHRHNHPQHSLRSTPADELDSGPGVTVEYGVSVSFECGDLGTGKVRHSGSFQLRPVATQFTTTVQSGDKYTVEEGL